MDASHLYHFKQHMDNFPHPSPAMGDVVSGGTFPTPHPPHNIAEDLAGLLHLLYGTSVSDETI